MLREIGKAAFRLLCVFGAPIGGIRPRRIYHYLGRWAYGPEDRRWHRNKWGVYMHLSPYYVIDRTIIISGAFDRPLHRLLQRLVRPGMTCLDVGANIGEVAMHLARIVGRRGRVHAFEPVRAVYERLKLHVERNGLAGIVQAHNVALAQRGGKAMIACPSSDQENQGLGSLFGFGLEALKRNEEVATTSLDDFVREQGIPRIDLAKIDAEGAELAILRGGEHVFADHSPDILIEVNPATLEPAGTDSHELCALLEAYGYGLYRVGSGCVGGRIHAQGVDARFYAENMLCTKRTVHS